jgi:hypothetical protein
MIVTIDELLHAVSTDPVVKISCHILRLDI